MLVQIVIDQKSFLKDPKSSLKYLKSQLNNRKSTPESEGL